MVVTSDLMLNIPASIINFHLYTMYFGEFVHIHATVAVVRDASTICKCQRSSLCKTPDSVPDSNDGKKVGLTQKELLSRPEWIAGRNRYKVDRKVVIQKVIHVQVSAQEQNMEMKVDTGSVVHKFKEDMERLFCVHNFRAGMERSFLLYEHTWRRVVSHSSFEERMEFLHLTRKRILCEDQCSTQ